MTYVAGSGGVDSVTECATHPPAEKRVVGSEVHPWEGLKYNLANYSEVVLKCVQALCACVYLFVLWASLKNCFETHTLYYNLQILMTIICYNKSG